MKTKEYFLNVNLNEISQVYKGKRDCCRCGCGGTYTATSFMNNPRSEVNDSYVMAQLQRAKSLIKKGVEFLAGNTFFDVKTGNNLSLTFYFDEIKK